MNPVHTIIRDQEQPGAVNSVRFSNTGEYLMTAGADRRPKLYNASTAQLITTYSGVALDKSSSSTGTKSTGHSREISTMDICDDNSRFITAGQDNFVALWDTGSGRVISKFPGHYQRINSICFDKMAGGSLFASGSFDTTVRLWDARVPSDRPAIGTWKHQQQQQQQKQSRCAQTMKEAKDSVSCVQFSHGGSCELMASSVDGAVRRYDLRQQLLLTETLSVPVTCAAYSNDMNCILCSCLDNTLRLIDRETGDILNEYQGHVNSQYRLECLFSADDSRVIAGSEEGSILVWDMVDGNVILNEQKHTKAVMSLSYHPTVDRLASSSSDGSVIIWSFAE